LIDADLLSTRTLAEVLEMALAASRPEESETREDEDQRPTVRVAA
jgi:hypothetical protein